MSNHYNSNEQEPNQVVEKILTTINNLWRALYISTLIYFKNFPSKVKNKWERFLNERQRIPKRKTKHRVYILIGYTSKENVDRRYRSVKIQKLISTFLILGMVLIFLVLIYRTIDSKLDYDAYRQMIGINDFDELIKKDPFNVQEGILSSDLADGSIDSTGEVSGTSYMTIPRE